MITLGHVWDVASTSEHVRRSTSSDTSEGRSRDQQACPFRRAKGKADRQPNHHMSNGEHLFGMRRVGTGPYHEAKRTLLQHTGIARRVADESRKRKK